MRAASSPAGSDGNSMDSVDGCCGPRKPDGFQNAQAGSNPKKVDLIIWEIEVPKVRAAGSKCPQAWGHQACWGGGGSEEGTGNPEAAPSGSQRLEGRECSTLPRSREPPCRRQFLQLPSGESFSKPQPDSPPLGLFFFFFFFVVLRSVWGCWQNLAEDRGRPGVPSLLCSCSPAQSVSYN